MSDVQNLILSLFDVVNDRFPLLNILKENIESNKITTYEELCSFKIFDEFKISEININEEVTQPPPSSPPSSPHKKSSIDESSSHNSSFIDVSISSCSDDNTISSISSDSNYNSSDNHLNFMYGGKENSLEDKLLRNIMNNIKHTKDNYQNNPIENINQQQTNYPVKQHKLQTLFNYQQPSQSSFQQPPLSPSYLKNYSNQQFYPEFSQIKNQMSQNPMLHNQMFQNQMSHNPMLHNQLPNQMSHNPMLQNSMLQNPMLQNPMLQNQMLHNPLQFGANKKDLNNKYEEHISNTTDYNLNNEQENYQENDQIPMFEFNT